MVKVKDTICIIPLPNLLLRTGEYVATVIDISECEAMCPPSSVPEENRLNCPKLMYGVMFNNKKYYSPHCICYVIKERQDD